MCKLLHVFKTMHTLKTLCIYLYKVYKVYTTAMLKRGHSYLCIFWVDFSIYSGIIFSKEIKKQEVWIYFGFTLNHT